ncbi:MAG TPA: hypothetical protein VFU88_17015, partial [Ktedonobacterales bacterium]|nr:hypothetical protein [Ktedonobacterales bacterium]
MSVEAPRETGSADPRPAEPEWRLEGNRPGPRSMVRLAGMRFTRGWRLLLAVSLGMLVAMVLICTVPLYDTLVNNLELQAALNTGDAPARNVEVEATCINVSADTYDHVNGQIHSLARTDLAPFAGSASTYYVVSAAMQLLQAGDRAFNLKDIATGVPPPLVTAEAFDYRTTAAHMRFLAGGPPAQAAGGALQVVITKQMADDFQLAVGSPIVWKQAGLRALTLPDGQQLQLTAHVSGIFEPNAVNDPYWNGQTFDAGFSPRDYPLLLTIPDFFGALAPFATVGMLQHWIYYTDPAAITTDNLTQVSQALTSFKRDVDTSFVRTPNVLAVTVRTGLDQTMRDLQAQQALLALPLYVVVAQIVGLVLLFIAAMASLWIEGQSLEIAALRSRGASSIQLLAVFMLSAGGLAIVIAVAAPFLGATLALGLAHAFVSASAFTAGGASGSYFASLANPRAVLLPDAVGVLLAAGVVAVAAWQSAGLDILAFRREQGRAGRPPLWKRLYLDLALVGLCAVSYLELDIFGDVATRSQLGGQGVSPLQLIGPALLLLAGALLIVRLFPLVAKLAARVAVRGRGLPGLLAMTQIERQPGRYTRLTLLLVLAVGLGVFALSFDASLQRNAANRSAYSTGADLRVLEDRALGAGGADANELQLFQALPGVAQVMPAYRTLADSSAGQGSQRLDVLAIDPARFGAISGRVAWRADYADQPLDALLAGMRAHIQGSHAGQPNAPVWALISQQLASRLHLRVGDHFALVPTENLFIQPTFVVGAVVREFPTLYPQAQPAGFMVAAYDDYLTAISGGGALDRTGANEYWMQARGAAAEKQALAAIAQHQATLQVKQVLSLEVGRAQAEGNPIVAGMRGLLLVGALTALLLAVVACLAEAALAARRRAPQFAILR